MDLISSMRRIGVLAKKRFNLFKYNIQFKQARGSPYSMIDDIKMMDHTSRSLNLLDFSANS